MRSGRCCCPCARASPGAAKRRGGGPEQEPPSSRVHGRRLPCLLFSVLFGLPGARRRLPAPAPAAPYAAAAAEASRSGVGGARSAAARSGVDSVPSATSAAISVLGQAELARDLGAVLAGARRLAPQARTPGGQHQRQPGQPRVGPGGRPARRVLGAGQVHRQQPAGGEQVRVAEQVARPVDGGEGQPQRLAARHQLGFRQRAEDLGDARPDARPRRGELAHAAELRIGQQVLQAERLAEAAPLRVGDHADEHLLARVGGVEDVVERPGLRHVGVAEGLRLAPLDPGARHVLRHQHHVGLEQAGLHQPAAAGPLALRQRRLDADHARTARP